MLDFVYLVLSLISLTGVMYMTTIADSPEILKLEILLLIVIVIFTYHFIKPGLRFILPELNRMRKNNQLTCYLGSFVFIILTLVVITGFTNHSTYEVFVPRELSSVTTLDNNSINLDDHLNWFDESREYVFETDTGRIITYTGKFIGYPEPVTDNPNNYFTGWKCVKYSPDQVIFRMTYTMK